MIEDATPLDEQCEHGAPHEKCKMVCVSCSHECSDHRDGLGCLSGSSHKRWGLVDSLIYACSCEKFEGSEP